MGVDGVTKETYGENLSENLDDLLKRMKQFSYKPYPVRRAYIPKGNGKMRGLGIPSFEDIVVPSRVGASSVICSTARPRRTAPRTRSPL